MIKSEELRIGNWIKNRDRYIKVDGFIFWHYQFPNDPRHVIEVSQLEPIPLTPEILKAAGFVVSDWGYKKDFGRFNKTGRWITKKFLAHEDLLENPFLRYDTIADIYFVHQLQNFYHALTGKELTLNLTQCHEPNMTAI